jgi:CDP-4-dehydro-6-deoxyglucose reductase, E1
MAASDPPAAGRSGVLEEIARLVEEHFASRPAGSSEGLPLSMPLFGPEEVTRAIEVLLSGRVTMGPRVREFERAFADYLGVRHALMVNSGSSANLLAVSVLAAGGTARGLRPGDEVIVPAVTWSTTVAPILQHGLVPVFVDVDANTLNLDVAQVEGALSARTRAIFPVHLLGNPVDMPAVMEVARRHDLWVIEDTCESLGSTVGGERAGAIGTFGTFSFYFSHHITTAEGGMLVTDDDELADVARSMRAHGWTRDMTNRAELEAESPEIDPRFLFVHVGYNLRPTEVQGAFGLVQLGRLDGYNRARRRNAERLAAALDGVDGLELVTEQPGGRSTWFGFPLLTRSAEGRVGLSRHLEERGIETRPIVAGNLAEQPAFRDRAHRRASDLETATSLGRRGLFVGNHPGLDDRRVDALAEAIRSFFA